MKLPAAFYAQLADQVAPQLLGARLCHLRQDGRCSIGRIVETEAYLGPRDLASHARFGRTARTEVMFAKPGHAYVYLVYGLHHCLNAVCGPPGLAHAVLLRALEPLAELELSPAGPGRLCKAMGIDRGYTGEDLRGDRLWIEAGPSNSEPVKRSARIGIDSARHWVPRRLRFYLAGNPWVSGPRRLTI